MVKALPPKIRLAGPGFAGAEVFNYYQIISVLSSLYVKALDRHDEGTYAGAWDTCFTSILEQIGIAHQCWEIVQAQAGTVPVAHQNIKLIQRTQTMARRLLTLDEHLTEWVSLERWSKLLMLAEKQLRRLGHEVSRQNPLLKGQLEGMNDAYAARLGLLGEICSVALKETLSLNQNYAEPVAL